MAGETISTRDIARMSNAHLVHAVMPTILAMIEAWPIRDGVEVSGIEIDGRDAKATIDGKIVIALTKRFLAELDAICVSSLGELPDLASTPAPSHQSGEG